MTAQFEIPPGEKENGRQVEEDGGGGQAGTDNAAEQTRAEDSTGAEQTKTNVSAL